MATISSLLFARHLRAEPTSHVLFWKDGALKREGRGLAFWFLPLGTSLAEVPLDDREITFCFRARSRDFQDVTVNGVIGYRITDPALLARHIDFSIDPASGGWNEEPLDRLAGLVTSLAQQLASTAIAKKPLTALLDEGVGAMRDAIHEGLTTDRAFSSIGVEIGSTRVSSIAPTPEMEQALQMPTREKIQQSADEATFQRRALAVEKERAIAENELANQIELAKRQEVLIGQATQNKRLEAEAAARNVRINAEAKADDIRLVEEAKVGAERARMEIYKVLPPEALLGLAARDLAGKLQTIGHLSLGGDSLTPLLEQLLRKKAST
ncbi:MAG: band 7 protein [Myxococcaceae bacterium]|nr:band 7 protein [Myxococcaceae bacterium]